MFLQDIPEKQPALMSLVYVGGLVMVALWLGVSLLRRVRRRTAMATVARDLPAEVRERLGVTSTNRGLYAVRIIFITLALTVFGFHLYWARYAETKNERFQELSYKDLRNRRLVESTLRGWILDRTGALDRALALYTLGPNGQISREYPLDREFAHLFGSDRGDAGLERALFGVESQSVPEAVDVVMERDIKQPGNLDARLTIDRELQKEAAAQLRDRHGAVVVLNPQNGEVLAMYSNPAFSLKEAQDEETWIRLEANDRDRPLVNRALGAYYIPGSTFKTVVMIAAFNAGMQGEEFMCTGAGFYAERGARPIWDAGGAGEVHGRIGMGRAYEVSCNQYFAQLAIKLGPQRLGETAQRLGIGVYDTPAGAVRGRRKPDIWNASNEAVTRAIAPRESTMVLYPRMRPYDIALEGFGQGYAGQQTPFQMALIAAAVANLNGNLMKPKLEMSQPDAVYSQVSSPQHAAEMRRIMGLVTAGAEGTARGVLGDVHATGVLTGGKTGTAEKDVPIYDPRTGEPKTEKKFERDRRGNIIREYEQLVIDPEKRIDSWFLCVAPLESPQVAIAVIVEGGGYGSKAAAPIAAALVLKARELGLLGLPAQGQPPQQQQPQGQPAPANPQRPNQQRQAREPVATTRTPAAAAPQRNTNAQPAATPRRRSGAAN
ncbi:MAG TPA: penicillin-binding transpeptidase domain-containing protein [Pyrinomonadaceae bacterium]|nr:penicillin-binding transpeptidase domain-containing protein [Pyrinomonadaceae bacterium]